jgi:hypothetical protein
MAKIFDDILVQGVRKGQIPARTQGARDWFRDKARSTRNAFAYPDNILKTSEGEKPRVGPGRMLHFYYDPKTKSQLPYYDRFPLIFHAGDAKGGFYGINLHYLPPQLRAALMDNLYDIASNTRYDESTRLRLSYGVLTGASKYRYFKPTFKHYLMDHVKSKFVEINSTEWDIALFLPTERFEKAGKSTVWADSRKMIS